ncbi:MAG: hypothetical protein WC549_01855 [Actinomycetota bacterium]
MGGFAPSNQFNAYQVLSQATSMSKTTDQQSVLEAQRKNFYRTSLIEIVTLLNGAVDRSYLCPLEAVHKHSSDSYTISARQIVVEADPIMGSGVDWMAGINLLQKRVVSNVIYDPLKLKQIDRIVSIEQRVEGAGASLTSVQNFSGQIKPCKLSEMQSIMKLDFAHGAYKDDIAYLEIGGNEEVANGGTWTSRESGCDYLPETGLDTDEIFNSYWIRLRKDRNSPKIPLAPAYVGASDYRRLIYTVWYNRLPNFPLEGTTAATDGWRPDSTSRSRFIDLPDKYMPLLVKRIYTYCLLQLQQTIPDQLSADIMNDYRQIYAMMDADTRATYQPQMQQIASQLGR